MSTPIGTAAGREFQIRRVEVTASGAWEAFTLPAWVRLVTLTNEHATEDLLVASPETAEAAHALATDHYETVPAGASVVFALAPGRGRVPDALRQVVLGRGAGHGSRDVAIRMGG